MQKCGRYIVEAGAKFEIFDELFPLFLLFRAYNFNIFKKFDLIAFFADYFIVQFIKEPLKIIKFISCIYLRILQCLILDELIDQLVGLVVFQGNVLDEGSIANNQIYCYLFFQLFVFILLRAFLKAPLILLELNSDIFVHSFFNQV